MATLEEFKATQDAIAADIDAVVAIVTTLSNGLDLVLANIAKLKAAAGPVDQATLDALEADAEATKSTADALITAFAAVQDKVVAAES